MNCLKVDGVPILAKYSELTSSPLLLDMGIGGDGLHSILPKYHLL